MRQLTFYLFSLTLYDICMADSKEHRDDQAIGKTFVIYDPEKEGYQKLCLCEYLSELPEVSPEEIRGYPENRKKQ